MIKIDEVKYGIQPYGPGGGALMLALYASDDGEQLDLSNLDQEKDFEKIRDIYADVAKNLFNQIKEKRKEAGLEKTYEDVVSYPFTGIAYGLIGNAFVDDDYFYPLCMLNDLISTEALEWQKLLHSQGKIGMIDPPHYTLIAEPRNQYINRNIFEIANYAFAVCNVRKKDADGNEEVISKDNKADFYHPNSLMNVNNHAQGGWLFRPENEEDIKLFDEFYEKDAVISKPFNVIVIPRSDDKKFIDKLSEWCIEKHHRLDIERKGKYILDFERNVN